MAIQGKIPQEPWPELYNVQLKHSPSTVWRELDYAYLSHPFLFTGIQHQTQGRSTKGPTPPCLWICCPGPETAVRHRRDGAAVLSTLVANDSDSDLLGRHSCI